MSEWPVENACDNLFVVDLEPGPIRNFFAFADPDPKELIRVWLW